MCKNGLRVLGIDFIVCSKAVEEHFNTPQEYAKAYCPFQKHCPMSGRKENTEEAKRCKKILSEQNKK